VTRSSDRYCGAPRALRPDGTRPSPRDGRPATRSRPGRAGDSDALGVDRADLHVRCKRPAEEPSRAPHFAPRTTGGMIRDASRRIRSPRSDRKNQFGRPPGRSTAIGAERVRVFAHGVQIGTMCQRTPKTTDRHIGEGIDVAVHRNEMRLPGSSRLHSHVVTSNKTPTTRISNVETRHRRDATTDSKLRQPALQQFPDSIHTCPVCPFWQVAGLPLSQPGPAAKVPRPARGGSLGPNGSAVSGSRRPAGAPGGRPSRPLFGALGHAPERPTGMGSVP
jgi:hypothetical protein